MKTCLIGGAAALSALVAAGCQSVGDAAYDEAAFDFCDELFDPAERARCQSDEVLRRAERNAARRAEANKNRP